MKFERLWPKREKAPQVKAEEAPKKTKEQLEVEALDEAEMSLRLLYDRFRRIFERQRRIALANEESNISNQDNYAAIGLAFYSLTLIKASQNRLRDIRDMKELSGNIAGLSDTVNVINNAGAKKDKFKTRELVSGAERMTGNSGGSSKALLKTYETLYNLKQNLPDERSANTGIDSIVDHEFLKKLIHEGNVDECVKTARGIKENPEKKLEQASVFRELTGETDLGSAEAGNEQELAEKALAEMHELLNSMPMG